MPEVENEQEIFLREKRSNPKAFQSPSQISFIMLIVVVANTSYSTLTLITASPVVCLEI
jgi:hypothetical protein